MNDATAKPVDEPLSLSHRALHRPCIGSSRTVIPRGDVAAFSQPAAFGYQSLPEERLNPV